jgi:hypothetical protein
VTAEEIKFDAREYAEQRFPGWESVAIVVNRGAGREPEVLIVTPAGVPGPVPDPSPLASSGTR